MAVILWDERKSIESSTSRLISRLSHMCSGRGAATQVQVGNITVTVSFADRLTYRATRHRAIDTLQSPLKGRIGVGLVGSMICVCMPLTVVKAWNIRAHVGRHTVY